MEHPPCRSCSRRLDGNPIHGRMPGAGRYLPPSHQLPKGPTAWPATAGRGCPRIDSGSRGLCTNVTKTKRTELPDQTKPSCKTKRTRATKPNEAELQDQTNPSDNTKRSRVAIPDDPSRETKRTRAAQDSACFAVIRSWARHSGGGIGSPSSSGGAPSTASGGCSVSTRGGSCSTSAPCRLSR
jgi:hypothetical protein